MSAPPPPYGAEIVKKVHCPPPSAPPPPYGAESVDCPPASAPPLLPDKASVVDIFHHLGGSTPPHSVEVTQAPKKKRWSFSFTSRKRKEPREMTLKERTALAKRTQKEAERWKKEKKERQHREKCEKIYKSLHANITEELRSVHGEVTEYADRGEHECHVIDYVYPTKYTDATSFVDSRRHVYDDDYKTYRQVVGNVVNDMNRTFRNEGVCHRLRHKEQTAWKYDMSQFERCNLTYEDRKYLSERGIEHKDPYEYKMKFAIFITWK